MKQNQTAYLAAVNAMEKLIAKSKQQKSTSLKSCIVGLYTADDQNPLRFSGNIGMLQIDFDRQHKLHFFRIYDIQTLELLMEVQIFYGFGQNFRKTGKDTVYIFDLYADGVIGFEFRNVHEAQIMALKIKSVSPKNQQIRQLMKDRIQKQIELKKQQTFFSKLKKKLNSLIHQQEHHQQSIVFKVENKRSIKMNFQTEEFDYDNIPHQWEDLLLKAGVMNEDTKDKQVLKIVFQETLVHQAKKAAQQYPDQVDQKHIDMIKQQIDYEDSKTTKSIVFSQYAQDLEIKTSEENQKFIESPHVIPIATKNNYLPQISVNHNDLMAEIRNNNLKLKPVKATEKAVELNLSFMNKQERQDLAEHIRRKFQLRKQALNRRKDSDEQDD